MAAAVADFTPARAGRRQDQEGRARSAWSSSSSRPPTSSRRSPRSAATARRWSASPPSTATQAVDVRRAASSTAQGPRRDRRQRHLARGHRLRRRRQRGHDPHAPRTARRSRAPRAARAKAQVAEAILDDGRELCAEQRLKCAADGERLRPLPARLRAARARRPPGRDRAAAARRATSSPTRPRSARRSGARCSTPSATRARPREFQAVAASDAHQRLRAVLPGPLDAAARTPSRGLPAARARLLAAARARGLPALPRPRAPRRRARARRRYARRLPRCYARSTAFVPACRRRQQYREWAPARFFCVRESEVHR